MTGCSRLITGVAERRIADCLPAYVGRADTWSVKVDGAPVDVLRGRFALITVTGRGVQVAGYGRCAELQLNLSNVDFDMARRRITSMGLARFALGLDERDVFAYLRQSEAPGDVRQMSSLRFGNGVVRARGTYRWMRVSHPFDVSARPAIRRTRIDYSPERMYIHGVRVLLPAGVLQAVARWLGYGFDLKGLPFPVTVEQVDVSDHRAITTGTMQIREYLNTAMAAGKAPGRSTH